MPIIQRDIRIKKKRVYERNATMIKYYINKYVYNSWLLAQSIVIDAVHYFCYINIDYEEKRILLFIESFAEKKNIEYGIYPAFIIILYTDVII